MYWYSDDRSIQFSFNRQKMGGIGLSMDTGPLFLTYILKYRLHRQLQV